MDRSSSVRRLPWQELTDLSVVTHDPTVALVRLVQLAGSVLPAAAGASVVLGPPDDPELIACSSLWTLRTDDAQSAACEGPTADAHWCGGTVRSTDLRADRRWPVLADALRDLPEPPGGCQAVPVRVQQAGGRPPAVVGVLTVYTTAGAPGGLAPVTTRQLLRRFAARPPGW